MNVENFIAAYTEAFGEKAKLPIAVWYGEQPAAEPERVNGCMFKALPRINTGEIVTFDKDAIGCGGGKFYSGFVPMPEFLPNFVSGKERYKDTPQMVLDFLDDVGMEMSAAPYLNFGRLDKIEDFNVVEALIFLGNPDVLTGLVSWAFLDSNDNSTVTTLFGSGCSAMITLPVKENREGGKRAFLGGFDPSVRPYFEVDELSLAVPMSRFREMLETMSRSSLYTHAWSNVKKRINDEQ